MTELGTEPSFRAYLHVLRRRKWWVASITLLGLAVSLALSLTSHKQYSATAQLLVQPSVTAASAGTAPQPVTQTDVATELQLVTSAPVQQAVRAKLGSAPAVTATQVGQTNVIAITATSRVPSRSARIANLYANAFVQYRQQVATSSLTSAEEQLKSQISALANQIKSLGGNPASAAASALLNQTAVLKEQLAQMQVSGASNTGEVELVTPATTPVSPSSPKPPQDALLGLIAGLALGLGAAFLRESMDDRLASKEAAERAGGAPVLAMTPLVLLRAAAGADGRDGGRAELPGRRIVSVAAHLTAVRPAGAAAAGDRGDQPGGRRRQDLHPGQPGGGLRPGRRAGPARLVRPAPAEDRRVLRPRRAGGPDQRPARRQHAGGDAGTGTWYRPAHPAPGRPIPPNPAELLNGSRVREIFTQLSEQFDLVLIDSPPVLPVTDAAILSQYADATLMLAAAGQTRRADLHRAAEKLDQVGATILGIVLNKVTRQTSREYGYGYGYGYGHEYKPFWKKEPEAIDTEHPNGNSKLGGRIAR